MPATEKTWRDQRVMHIVFAGTSVVMLLSTFLMFAQDHNRPWKPFQRQSRDIERRMSQWRLDTENSRENQRARDQLQAELQTLRSQVIPAELLDRFQQQVRADEARRTAEAQRPEIKDFVGTVKPYDFADINANSERLAAAAETANQRRAEVQALDDQLQAAQDVVSQLITQLNEANSSGAETTDIETLQQQVDENTAQEQQLRQQVEDARAAALAAEEEARAIREEILDELNDIVQDAKLREDVLASDRKFTGAFLDAAKANYGLMVRDGRDERLPAAQNVIDPIQEKLGLLTLLRDDAIANRKELREIVRQITLSETEVKEQLEDSLADAERLESAIDERQSTFFTSSPPFLGKRWLEMPILTAFNSPLKIDNLWTEGLTQPIGSFGQVRRFDRCTTCHKAIDKAMPGSAVEPAYTPAEEIDFTLFTPQEQPQPTVDADGNEQPVTLESVYGIRLAEYGLADDDDVTISYVAPESLAANAIMQVAEGEIADHGLRVGDVLVFVNGDDKVLGPAEAYEFLIQGASWGEPVTLTIRRGLPNPYTSHPRLDLFVGSLSPHKLSDVACTVCHEGQGSATDFKWVSHTPNDPEQADEWARKHGWFNNHHWIYPMFPKRFVESACLKCHHDVTSLMPSVRFPDPPAPKVVEGYELVKQYGCYGCHEINGYSGPDKRVGPDIRLEPNYSPAAQAIKADPNFAALDDVVQENVRTLIHQPENDAVRVELRDWLLKDAAAEEPILTKASLDMAEVLKDVENPGTMRKAGPTLRYIATKLGEPFLSDWIREPKNFRPSTKMPQFFGHWDHLSGNDLKLSQEYEPIEILGIVKYLLAKSQPMEYLPQVEGVESGAREEQIARGKQLFELRGCLACHKHGDFPGATSDFGPDLSNVGDKFSAAAGAPNGRAWLYTWIKQPMHYGPRTKMPNLFLDPITENGQTIDPAADIVEFLLSSSNDWQPDEQAFNLDPEVLDRFVLENLATTFVTRMAKKFLAEGIPPEMADSLKGSEIELVGDNITQDMKLQYVGRKTIIRYGCHGCHDIPGFENAKTIGTGLADWGRKDTSRLAFEHILEYLHGHHGGHSQNHAEGHEGDGESALAAMEATVASGMAGEDEHFDESYYDQQLEEGSRIGFIWQKLKEPRSYDFMKTKHKRYDERLRMPLFPFTEEQREAVVTFVLGLVAEPPAEQFVFHPDPQQEALIQGRDVIEKYNCAGCHIFELQRWDLEFQPGDLAAPGSVNDYDFLAAHISDLELTQSATPDPNRGVLRTSIVGLQAIDNDTGLPIVWDEEGDPLEEGEEYDPSTFLYPFDLWEPVAIAGEINDRSIPQIAVPANMIYKRSPGWGGDLTRLLLPTVVAVEKQANPAANGTEAWGWLPPPLVGQGAKVQPDWLHSFLLDPYPIRPAAFLRMPKFNMSSTEATHLVNYFAAREGMEYPFEFDPRTRSTHLAAAEDEFQQSSGSGMSRLDQAMRIVTNGNYCVKCHPVGGYEPEGSDRAKAPDLAVVHDRLRPEYVRRWIANPKKILPYTSMPVNIPFDPNSSHLGGVDQGIFPGTSIQQVDALVDLLMNYPTFTSNKNDISDLVRQGAAAAPAASDGAQVVPEPEPAEAAENAARPAQDASALNLLPTR